MSQTSIEVKENLKSLKWKKGNQDSTKCTMQGSLVNKPTSCENCEIDETIASEWTDTLTHIDTLLDFEQHHSSVPSLSPKFIVGMKFKSEVPSPKVFKKKKQKLRREAFRSPSNFKEFSKITPTMVDSVLLRSSPLNKQTD